MSILCHTCDLLVPDDHDRPCPTCGRTMPTCAAWCSCGTTFDRVGYDGRHVKAITGWKPYHEGQKKPENLKIGTIWVDPYWHIYNPHCPKCGSRVKIDKVTDKFYCTECTWKEE